MSDITKDFEQVRVEIKESLSKSYQTKASLFVNTNFNGYVSQFSKALHLMMKEPEILLFLALQWLTVSTAYFVWSQFFNWIPDQVWHAISESKNTTLFDLIFLVWSFLIVALASYPLAIFNAAIVAVHNLHACGQSSTTFKALALAFRNIDKLWMFSTVDNWITVDAIIDRLPVKDKENRRTFSDELLYYAWKLATITVVPSLLCGRGFTGAAKDALELYKKVPMQLISLRLGYSAACWVLGIVVYFLGVLFMCSIIRSLIDMPTFYLIILCLGLPILFSAAFIIIILRPAFLLGIAQIYSENIDVRSHTKLRLDETPINLLFDLSNILFLLVLIAVFITAFYAQEIGVAEWITQIAQAGLARK